jgi:hypothetical protein
VSSRLTKLGVEVPYRSEFVGTSGESRSAGSQSQSSSDAGERQRLGPTMASVPGSLGSNLTKLGIEMPRSVGSKGVEMPNGGSRALSDMKSMETSLTQLGVDVPLRHYACTVKLGASYESDGKARTFTPNKSQHEPASPVLSMSKTDDSSALQSGSSRDYGNSIGMAKQQLMAELREATSLMAESKTREAAKFWRDHVLELEARLRALSGDQVSPVPSTDKATIPLVRSESGQGDEDASEEPVKQGTRATEGDDGLGASTGRFSPLLTSRFQATSSHHIGANEPISARMDVAAVRAPLMLDPSLERVPMVDVVAPADLPGGYHFEAEIEGRRFLATVPAGGVQKGETFSCYMRDLEKVGSDIPVGRWRDGLFDCCRVGCCHAVIWNGLLCPLGKFDLSFDANLLSQDHCPNCLLSCLCSALEPNFDTRRVRFLGTSKSRQQHQWPKDVVDHSVVLGVYEPSTVCCL